MSLFGLWGRNVLPEKKQFIATNPRQVEYLMPMIDTELFEKKLITESSTQPLDPTNFKFEKGPDYIAIVYRFDEIIWGEAHKFEFEYTSDVSDVTSDRNRHWKQLLYQYKESLKNEHANMLRLQLIVFMNWMPTSMYPYVTLPRSEISTISTEIRPIGEGGHGKVVLNQQNRSIPLTSIGKSIKALLDAEVKNTLSKMYVVKQVDLTKVHETYAMASVEVLSSFITKLKGCSQHYIVKYFYMFGIKETKDILYMYMEYIEGKSLLYHHIAIGGSVKHAVRESTLISIETLIRMFEKLIGALQCLHKSGIYHRDIKPANIMIRKNEWFDPVLVDFGLTCGGYGSYFSVCEETDARGTPIYMAPELFKMQYMKHPDSFQSLRDESCRGKYRLYTPLTEDQLAEIADSWAL